MDLRSLLRVLALTMLMLLAAASAGCRSKKTLDADVDHLLAAIASSDYEHFKADAHPSLVDEVSAQEFDSMARALKALGPLESKSMTAIRVKSGAPTEGDYAMKFAHGSCSLAIKSLDGKLVGFHFTGPDIERLSKEP